LLKDSHLAAASNALLCGCDDLAIFEQPEFCNSLLRIYSVFPAGRAYPSGPLFHIAEKK